MTEKTIYRNYSYTVEHDADYTDGPTDWTEPTDRAENGGVYYALKRRNYTLPYEVEYEIENANSWRDLAACVTDENSGQLPGYKYKFVDWYEHGNVVVHLSDSDERSGWDSGCAGVIFAPTTDDIESHFTAWKQYVEGDVWSVAVYDQHGEFVDSLSGIYGYDQAKREAEAIINYALSKPRAGHHPVKASALHK